MIYVIEFYTIHEGAKVEHTAIASDLEILKSQHQQLLRNGGHPTAFYTKEYLPWKLLIGNTA